MRFRQTILFYFLTGSVTVSNIAHAFLSNKMDGKSKTNILSVKLFMPVLYKQLNFEKLLAQSHPQNLEEQSFDFRICHKCSKILH